MTQQTHLTREDLWSLEQYSVKRPEFRKEVMAYKKNRQVTVADSARFCFEDLTTIRYQIQEILRVEKVFEAADIQEEIDSYNPLIPDGKNLKATFMLEYDDIDERESRGEASERGDEDEGQQQQRFFFFFLFFFCECQGRRAGRVADAGETTTTATVTKGEGFESRRGERRRR